jgi:hypothetical protein
VRFPVLLAERTGLAAFIRGPITLRSGAVIDPVHIKARFGKRSAAFPDSSWLALSVLAQQPGEFVDSKAIGQAVFDRATSEAVRSAVRRARLTLESIGAYGDIELADNRRGGWRLLLAEEA